ncbi:MAG: urease accessory UreF family protein [Pseudomonadota bacterium]|nr:urease accessory UreF family protein [Pseudomonadota bacterium]
MLSSTALPIGAYCYSQGVETAIECGIIRHEASALAYFEDVLELVLARYELPMLAKMIAAASNSASSPTTDQTTFLALAERYRASRESRELLAETQQLGFSLNAWIRDVLKQPVTVDAKLGFLPVYAQLAARLQLPVAECLTAYAFTLLENQVLAVVKTVPLGQMSGQRVLWELHAQIPDAVAQALLVTRDSACPTTQQPSNSLPNLAMLSMQHESQYSRLFRS